VRRGGGAQGYNLRCRRAHCGGAALPAMLRRRPSPLNAPPLGSLLLLLSLPLRHPGPLPGAQCYYRRRRRLPVPRRVTARRYSVEEGNRTPLRCRWETRNCGGARQRGFWEEPHHDGKRASFKQESIISKEQIAFL